jgi:hypothetical protein
LGFTAKKSGLDFDFQAVLRSFSQSDCKDMAFWQNNKSAPLFFAIFFVAYGLP